MPSAAPISPLRQMLENQISQLSAEVESLLAETRGRVRREYADLLNQGVRRMRQAKDIEELGATLVDATGGLSSGCALLRIAGGAAKGDRIRGVPEPAAEAFRSLEIPLASAAALAGAVESREPVVALTTGGEVSAEIAQLVGHPPEGRVSIFPVVMRERAAALLYAWGEVEGPAIELLAQVASAVWSAMETPAAAGLVHIATAVEPKAPLSPARKGLPAEEQPIHLRAQRVARVEAAEIRLTESASVKAGRAQRNLYEELRKPIDAARERFRETFFAGHPGMIDYLHGELVHTLANDDPELLGETYPGPLG